MEAIILAGGKGTRLQSVVADVPKPMAQVADRPFLEFLLDELVAANCERVVLSVGYKWEVIKEHFGTEYRGINIGYAVENEPLGTGGAIMLALQKAESDHVLVLNGDTYFEVDLNGFMEAHHASKSPLSIGLKRMENPDRYGTVELSGDRILRFNEKITGLDSGLINAGVYALDKQAFSELDLPTKFSFEAEILEKLVGSWNFHGFEAREFFIDIGIPEDYRKADAYFRMPSMMQDWTLFLDRDGVINVRVVGDYIRSLAGFEFLPHVKEAIRDFSSLFKRVIVVTNQQGVGKGLMTEADVQEIHVHMIKEIEAAGGRIDKVYFCPALDAENNPCRKPNNGMALQAQQDFPEIDLNRSLMIGDSLSDMEFGRRSGMFNAFITPEPYKNETPLTDIEAINLLEIGSYLQRSRISSKTKFEM